MRFLALLSLAPLAACSNGPYFRRQLTLNSSSITSASQVTLSTSDTTTTTTTVDLTSLSTSLSSPISTSARPLTRLITSPVDTSYTSYNVSTSHRPANRTSLVTTNATHAAPTKCTGCNLEAFWPTTIWYDDKDPLPSTTWTSVVVTETVLVLTVTYMQGTAIDTVITTEETIHQTKTVIGTANQTVTLTAPVFTFEPTYGTTLTLEAGPTYVVYTEFWGGLEWPSETETATTAVLTTYQEEPTCGVDVSMLYMDYWQPTRTEDWSSFIQTFTTSPPENDYSTPMPLPPAVVEFFKLDPDIQSIFNGSDIATCTLHATSRLGFPPGPPNFPPPSATPGGSTALMTAPVSMVTQRPPEWQAPSTSTYISVTYESTSTHVTRQGCLRCNTPTQLIPIPIVPTNNPEPSRVDPQQIPTKDPDIPAILNSIIHDPQFTQGPQRNPNNPVQTITIGDTVVTIHPAQPTQPNQQNTQDPQNPQNPQNPGVVVGSQTLTAGQTTTINGVEVVVPSGGSSIVVGGSTIAVNPAPTGPPVLTVGDKTVTANSQGQFMIGTQTLTPGGPAITVDGSTLSLGPSGTIAVVNGITQTLGNAPFMTGPPVLTVNGQTISATVIGGTTGFVIAPGQTLTAGGVLTVDGTTFSMPVGGSGSTVVVNGVTSTLAASGLPVLTLNNQIVTASVTGGTTAFVLGPGQTLMPGSVITLSGTTYSMPASASGSVVVVNGVTTTLGQGPVTAAPALTIDGKTFSATTRDGTTEYVLGPGTTLKPGEAITVSGTTYSLDPKGTALVINGRTSSIPSLPATNSATTTHSGSISSSTGVSSSESSSSTTSQREIGNFIASGIGISKTGGAGLGRSGGLDKWVEGVVVGVAGWLIMFL